MGDCGAESADLLHDERVVPPDQLGDDPLEKPDAGLVRCNGDDEVDGHCFFGAFDRGVEVVARFRRREAGEQLVELAVEPGRVLTRRPARSDLGLYLTANVLEVDDRLGHGGEEATVPAGPRLDLRLWRPGNITRYD